MKLKVLIGYNDKELDRYVSLGEIIEVTEERAEVLEKVKDYLGRNIVERIKEEGKQKENATDETDNQESDSQEQEKQDPEKQNQESENMDSKNSEEENKNQKNIDQKNRKIEAKNEEGVP